MECLIDFFDSDELDDGAMCFTETHGFLTSLAIRFGSLSQADVLKEIFVTPPVNESTCDAILSLQKDIQQSLLNCDFPDILSCHDEDAVSLWSMGFMQGVFLQEVLWFSSHAEEVAELTLPILSCSELLDDEIDSISQNEEILSDMAEKIPDCVIDLYLLFNTPDSA
ncbi:MAG: metal-binding protein [Cycloclasticus sp. symbiont of Poecilosclerida sp. M]|nr:MAG: metal-binding protein [Cycloclasticus sp. symbiont of Poecilosclerida sp. M]